jgi:hypothetical protein
MVRCSPHKTDPAGTLKIPQDLQRFRGIVEDSPGTFDFLQNLCTFCRKFGLPAESSDFPQDLKSSCGIFGSSPGSFEFLQNVATFCRIFQLASESRTFLQNLSTFCRIFQDSAGSSKFLRKFECFRGIFGLSAESFDFLPEISSSCRIFALPAGSLDFLRNLRRFCGVFKVPAESFFRAITTEALLKTRRSNRALFSCHVPIGRVSDSLTIGIASDVAAKKKESDPLLLNCLRTGQIPIRALRARNDLLDTDDRLERAPVRITEHA